MAHSNSIGELFLVNTQDSKRQDSNLFERAYQFDIFSFSLEKNFQNRIKELEDYLERLLNSDDKYVPLTFIREHPSTLAEAKRIFKESSFGIIDKMKENYENEKKIHLIPDSYLRQMVESIKQQFFLTYNHLIQNLINTIYQKQQIVASPVEENKVIDPPARQKLKPGKTKFPKKARQVLEAWYKNHSDDPFPSHAEKNRLAEESGVTIKQVKCWFINVRRKRWNKVSEDADFKGQIEKKLLQNVDELKTTSNMI